MTISLLLIEDDQRLGRAMRLRLTRDGYTMYHTTTGTYGVELARANRPDVVLLDIRLPDIDGFEVCHRIRHTPGIEHTKIIFLSTHTQLSFRKRAEQAGGDLFLSKTCRPMEIYEAIQSLTTQCSTTQKQTAVFRSEES